MLMRWLMKRKSSSRRYGRGWHQKPFHATGQGGRSTDGLKGASAQPGLASPQLPETNEQEAGGRGGPEDRVQCCGTVLGDVMLRHGVDSQQRLGFPPAPTDPCPTAAGCWLLQARWGDSANCLHCSVVYLGRYAASCLPSVRVYSRSHSFDCKF